MRCSTSDVRARTSLDELGWAPAHSFEQGIADTVDWYLDHQDWVQRVLDGSYRLERIGGVPA